MHREYIRRLIADIWKVDTLEIRRESSQESQKAKGVISNAHSVQQDTGKASNAYSAKQQSLLRELVKGAGGQEMPLVRQDACGVFWFCIREQDSDVFLVGGPLTVTPMDIISRHYFFKYYGQKEENGDIPVVRLPQLMALLRMIDVSLNGRETSDDEILCGNHLARESSPNTEAERENEIRREDDEERYHHSYQQERKVLECVRNGNLQEALSLSSALLDSTGRMGTDVKSHWYNLLVSCITLITRSAIEGGLSPGQAYRLSDAYVQKLHYRDNIVEYEQLFIDALTDFTKRVSDLQGRHHSGYVTAGKEFVNRFYREKIYVGDAARAVGISEGHFSRIFHEEEGQTFQSYLLEFRLKRSENLLKYSDKPIGEISIYCGFPSQSYFSDKFRKYTGLAPSEYRRKFKPAEFNGVE